MPNKIDNFKDLGKFFSDITSNGTNKPREFDEFILRYAIGLTDYELPIDEAQAILVFNALLRDEREDNNPYGSN